MSNTNITGKLKSKGGRTDNKVLVLQTKGLTRKHADTKVAMAKLYYNSPYLSEARKKELINEIGGIKLKNDGIEKEYSQVMELGKQTGLRKSTVNNKEDVRLIGIKAKQLMKFDNGIWDKYKWRSGSDVDKKIYTKEVKDYITKNGKLSPIYEHILEDANYHSLNEAINRVKGFSGSYGEAEEDFNNYEKFGEKTWDL